MDEQERIDRRAHVRLIVTEVLMFLSVILLVGFLTLIVMGYSFNLREIGGSGEVVERSGLVQISSQPAGATIFIDGEAPLLLSTNASRTMLSGEHEIALEKDGFLGWKKTVKVTEGLMYRLNYPRLIKTERETEEVFTFEFGAVDLVSVPEKYAFQGTVKAEGVKFVSVSPNHEKMVVLVESRLFMMNLNEDKPELKLLEVLDSDGVKNLEVATVEKAEWSGNSERMLAKVNGAWAVINVRSPKETVWLSEVLPEKTMSDIKFENEAGDRLLVLNVKKELMELSVRDKKLSEALLSGVVRFDNDGDRIVFVDEDAKLRAYRVGERDEYLVAEADKEAKLAAMRYFQESYVGMVVEGKFAVYRKTGWVASDEEMEKVFEEEVGFEVADVKKRGKGMVFEIVGTEGESKVFDIEAMTLATVNVKNAGWVDEYLRYRVEDGKLSVLDYDGLNERELVSEGVAKGRVVMISGNNRWLYYFAKVEGGEKLVREKII